MQIFKYEKYLNDAIINFAIVHLFSKLEQKNKQQIHIFDNNFYESLTSVNNSNCDLTDSERKHMNVARWTKKTDLFKKQLIVIPVCKEKHWFLILVINPGVITVTT
jgi:Ulp1 family protease